MAPSVKTWSLADSGGFIDCLVAELLFMFGGKNQGRLLRCHGPHPGLSGLSDGTYLRGQQNASFLSRTSGPCSFFCGGGDLDMSYKHCTHLRISRAYLDTSHTYSPPIGPFNREQEVPTLLCSACKLSKTRSSIPATVFKKEKYPPSTSERSHRLHFCERTVDCVH